VAASRPLDRQAGDGRGLEDRISELLREHRGGHDRQEQETEHRGDRAFTSRASAVLRGEASVAPPRVNRHRVDAVIP
jgi:hypothetical protein